MPTPTQHSSDTGKAILADMAKLGEKIPALRSITESFGQILAVRATLRQQAPGWHGPPPALNAGRFSEGAWILADTGFQDVSGSLDMAVGLLMPVIKHSFPALAAEMDALAKALREKSLSSSDIVAAASGQMKVSVAGVSGETLGFMAGELVKPFLERQAQDLSALVTGLPWRHGNCPVCGGLPNFSQLRPGRDDAEYVQSYGGQRWVRCTTCSTEWRSKRVSCLACGNEEPDDLVCLSIAGRPQERADACRKCKTYSLCLDASQSQAAADPDVAALSMLPLEMLARKEGYSPLGEHPWSVGL